jgi:L-ascorbate metabolism protein UlaG (beta-lactamase superfamily)
MNQLYLKTNVVAEPLVNDWYAWHLLINPATYALILKNLHISVMNSYVESPDIHQATVKEAKMRGGPFADFLGENQVIEVKKLLDMTLENNTLLLKMAEAFYSLNTMLQNNATGASLSELYAKVPVALKGLVELVYDINNYPGFRIFEGLLFESEYYSTASQGFDFYELQTDHRPFVLSTPRIKKENHLKAQVDFDNMWVDKLFSTRTRGITLNELDEFYERYIIKNSQSDYQIFKSMFTHDRLVTDYLKPSKNDIRIRYFGHACVLIETSDISILIDPLISYTNSNGISRFSLVDLPEKIDYVLLSHAHQDHVMLETLIQIRYKIKTIIIPKNNPGLLHDPSLKYVLRKIGFKNIIELSDLDSEFFNEGHITGIPFLGEHGDLNIASKLCYLVQIATKKILFVADSNNLEPEVYNRLKSLFAPVDIIFLGMECEGAPMSWLYGPLFMQKITRKMDQSRRLDGSNSEKAWALIQAFECSKIYIYAMGQEPWLGYITNIVYDEKAKPIVESNKLISKGIDNHKTIERLFAKKEICLDK